MMSYHWCETTHTSHMNIHVWMYQFGKTPLIFAATKGHFPVVEYLLEKGADLEAKTRVSDVTSLIWNHAYVTYDHMYLWMYQHGITPLMWAAMKGHLPVVEYLVERGADMEAKDNEVSDITPPMWYRTYVKYAYLSVNGSGWIHSIDTCCKGRSFTNGWIFGGERS